MIPRKKYSGTVWITATLFSAIFLSFSQSQSIPVGGGYVGCGYDVLTGNPDGASFTNGGLDPGLKPAKFILRKTFKENSYCPAEATCVELGGMFGEETFSLNADLQQYKDEYSALWTQESSVSVLIASFGGTLSAAYREAQKLINSQEKVILNKRRITITGDATYNTRGNRRLDPEFLQALCDLPLTYSQDVYGDFLKEWGTHVVTAAKLGVRESWREDFSKKIIINALQRNQSYAISNSGGFLSFVSSSLTGQLSDQLVSEFRSDKQSQNRWTSAVGSPMAPAPISLTLRGLETFIVPTSFRDGNNGSSSSCATLQTTGDLASIRANVIRALSDYPNISGAQTPTAITRMSNLTWPKGTYSLLMAHDGCPLGPWANGTRHHDTVDRFPDNEWSSGFENRTASSLFYNNLDLRFCSKIFEFEDGAMDWSQGAYCTFKRGDCPDNFEVGNFYVDDEFFFNANWFAGTLPDGEYRKKTRYYFCCRNDGAVNKPIFLPTQRPFLLMPMGPSCQVVAGMQAEMHWLKIDTMWKGWSMMTGKVPFSMMNNTARWTVYFCYYSAIQSQ